jgi:cytoskeletal protein CcmA (bactofilin family)
MFGSSKETEDSKKATITSTSGTLNALVKGTVIEGTVRCDNDLRVDGTIKGKLSCQSKVIIGPTGVVEGEIRCQNAVIEGRFKGNQNLRGYRTLYQCLPRMRRNGARGTDAL